MALAPFAKASTDLDAHIAVRIELSRSLTGHSGPVSVIQLKEPTLGDYIDCGSIVRRMAHDPRLTQEIRIEIIEDTTALMRWFVRLSGLGEAVLRQLAPRDAFAVKSEIEKLVAEFESGNAPGGRPS